MQWEGWGGLYKTPLEGNDAFFCNYRHLPKILKGHDHHCEYSDLEPQFDPDNIKKLYIWDAAGNEWNLSWWKLRRLINEIKAAQTSSGHA